MQAGAKDSGKPRVVISGGGTGGHIFPAISIANAVKALCPGADILFVGALGRMEMQRVPQAGYEIRGLPVRGLDRGNPLRNVAVLAALARSIRMAGGLVREFSPDVAVGVGGYASGPMLYACSRKGIPLLIQEQNSYAGVANRLLARRASRICVAYDGMERFFPADRILKTGNPVRQALLSSPLTKGEALASFGLGTGAATILVTGGSLGARTLNESVLGSLDLIRESGVQVIWQTGRHYHDSVRKALAGAGDVPGLAVADFISDMAAAYKAADLVVSRAGASSISEFCLMGKPVILVPSPNVAEDHQTRNAMALVGRGAALCVRDADAPGSLMDMAVRTVKDDAALGRLSEGIRRMALPGSADAIAREVMGLAAGRRA